MAQDGDRWRRMAQDGAGWRQMAPATESVGLGGAIVATRWWIALANNILIIEVSGALLTSWPGRPLGPGLAFHCAARVMFIWIYHGVGVGHLGGLGIFPATPV
eukprot:9014458-Pyramimonas_sp.AAC.1